MRDFQLKIVKPDKTFFNGKVVYCHFTTSEGEMGVKAYHEAFMAVLKDDTPFLYRNPDGSEESLNVANAIITFKENSCTVVMT